MGEIVRPTDRIAGLFHAVCHGDRLHTDLLATDHATATDPARIAANIPAKIRFYFASHHGNSLIYARKS
jgi:hypothetical protein